MSRTVMPNLRQVLALGLCALVTDPLVPATIVVEGSCTLVEAIISANDDAAGPSCPAGSGADTIVLTYDVILSSIGEIDEGHNGLPTIRSPITIDGRNHSIERNPAAAEFRIARIAFGGELTLDRVTVSGGRERWGGAFWNRGALVLKNSTLSSNRAEVAGGAIFNYDLAYLDIYRSTLSLNTVSGLDSTKVQGGAIHNGYPSSTTVRDSVFAGNLIGTSPFFTGNAYGGAIVNDGGELIVSGSTFSGNSISFAGPVEKGTAIASFSPDPDSLIINTTVSFNGNSSPLVNAAALYVHQFLALEHVTFSGNSDSALGAGTNADLTIESSVIANTSGGPNCSGTFIDGGGNLADDASCGTIPSGLSGLDPVLTDNGGPTETHALVAGSNAVGNAGPCRRPDQRGAPRIGACDSGAFEYLGCPQLTLENDTVAVPETHEDCSFALGPNLAVIGPGGDLTLRFGSRATLENGVSVAPGASLRFEHDAPLQLLLPELIEADRARRRAASAVRAERDPPR